MKKNALLFSIMLITMLLLSGCWNYREIDKLAIVSGLAIDKNAQGDQFLLTAEIIDLKETMTQSKIASRKIEAKGESIFDAMRNMIKISAKKLYWSHAKAIVVSKDVATQDIVSIVDWISRDHEARITLNLFVSKEQTASELLFQQSVTTDIRSFEMEDMLMGNRSLSKAPNVKVYEFMNDLSEEGISGILPALGITMNMDEKTAELSGTAVFKKEKFIGFLDEEDSKFLLFVKDKIKGGVYTIKVEEESPNEIITLEIFKNKTKITPVYNNDILSIMISTTTEVAIEEQNTTNNYIDEEGRKKLISIAEKTLEQDVENTIKKVQQDFGSDIFGFGRIVKAEMPSLWKTMDKKWDTIFKDLEVHVNSEIKIKNSSLTSAPLKVGD
ncbi:MAG: Ger(x)C family spore germination protein [Epulopiscium sp.]|mgnify:CR=1 FL=1|nr:Ger(x)C family spore germination protein [Candidatus Epulonipiscium sp.]